jgi:cyclase
MSGIIKKQFDSKYFILQELTEGVYSAIEKKEADTGSNAGFVDMGDYTLAFDAFLNIDAAKDLIAASEALTGKAPSMLVNSHFHADHVVGNCMLGKDARIITSKAAYEKMLTDSTKMMQEIQGLEPKVLDDLKAQISSEKDTVKLLDMKNEYKFLSNIMKPGVQLRLPDITFEETSTLHGKARRAELITFGTAHSHGDVVLYLPEEKICFVGDLLFKNSHPWLGAGEPENFISVLEKLLNMDVKIFIPGHGELAVKNDIELEIKYIKELLSLVDAKKAKGETSDTVSLNDISPEFLDWDDLCFMWNVDFLFKRHGQ